MEYFLDSRFGSAKEFANDFLGFVVQETEWGKSLPQTFRQKFIRPVCIVVIKYFNKTKESQYLYLQEKISLANLQKFLGCGAVYVYSGFNEKVIVDEDMFENLCFVGKKKYGVVEIYEL
ncbi:hypothetical protein M0811_09133 [Anaeramoeba ignava]|uniref:Uncharacterized protein n=1 Tax=Anaeramoeba ignava TaxID=1746090 RepID=A0A9Q0LGK1_ANAIG|nr:hypothetical protein M0811_09133 [Anaeramoeba ignava]